MARKFASLRSAEQEMLRDRYPDRVFEPDEDVTENGRPYAHLFASVTDPQHTQPHRTDPCGNQCHARAR